MTISHAIAAAVETVKRWAAGGGGVKPDTRVKAQAAVAEWEAKRGKAKVKTLAENAVHKEAVPDMLMLDGEEVHVEPVMLSLGEGPTLEINTPEGTYSFTPDGALDPVNKALVSLPPDRRTLHVRPIPEGVEVELADRKVVWAPTAKALGADVVDAEIIFVGDGVDPVVPEAFGGVLWPADDAGTMFAVAADDDETNAAADVDSDGFLKRLWGPFAKRDRP